MDGLVILILTDNAEYRHRLESMVKDEFDVLFASELEEALEIISSLPMVMVIAGMTGGFDDYVETYGLMKESNPDVGVIFIAPDMDISMALRAVDAGAYDCFSITAPREKLLVTLRKYSYRASLRQEISFLREELRSRYGHNNMIGSSSLIMKTFDLVKKVSPSNANVLITGESGTGKELVAMAIHRGSARKDFNFVAVNCGAIPAALLESELFGHVRGAFTGASEDKVGKFEFANRGTIFLDEIASLPLELQVKLLRVLQDRTFNKVGSNKQVRVDVRVIAATNIDLAKAVKEKTFRDDLYYRLRVVPIDMPTLRARKEDIPLLVEWFLEKHCKHANKHIKGVSTEAMGALISYGWPGNIRELENLIERVVVLAQGASVIEFEDIPVEICDPMIKEDNYQYKDISYRDAVNDFERKYIIDLLNRTKWNRAEAARLMKVHRNTLTQKIKRLNIRRSMKEYEG